MTAIDIDFDVFKKLTHLRRSEDVSYNDVLRDILKLPKAGPTVEPDGGWSWKGVALPNGTKLKADYKGRAFSAEIQGDQWVQGGKTYKSPSAAAYAVTKSGINGWGFWLVKRPIDAAWAPLDHLRR